MPLRSTPLGSQLPRGTTADATLSFCVLAAGVALALLGGIHRAGGAVRPARPVPAMTDLDLETLVGSLASWAGAATVAWWVLSTVMAFLSAVSTLRGRHAPAEQLGRWAPAFMRRLALAVLGLSLVGGPAAQAAVGLPTESHQRPSITAPADRPEAPGRRASTTPLGAESHTRIPAPTGSAQGALPSDSLDPRWTGGQSSRIAAEHGNPAAEVPWSNGAPADPDPLNPGWTPSSGPPEPGHLAPVPRRAPLAHGSALREVEVRPGDSLWSLAARELGPTATDLDIARFWPRWHTANRSVIGEDPDRLLPGMVLRIPDRQ